MEDNVIANQEALLFVLLPEKPLPPAKRYREELDVSFG